MLRARVDANQKEIVAKLRQVGVDVLHLHRLGKNAPDICCGYHGVNVLLEIKSKPKQTRGNTPKAVREANQIEWCLAWKGPAYVVRSFEEAIYYVNRAAGRL